MQRVRPGHHDGEEMAEVLRRHFGHQAFLPGQREAISEVLAGRSALLVTPTGGGKSLCYRFAAALRRGTVLVVSPLISTMQDQLERLDRRCGVVATVIGGSLGPRQRWSLQEQMVAGKYDLLYVSPEQLDDAGFVEAAQMAQPWLLAVDQAHCIAEWGRRFRPAYLRIREFADRVGPPAILALAAAATVRTRQEIIEQLGLHEARQIVTSFDRPNLLFEVRRAENEDEKLANLAELFRGFGERALVYAGTRVEAETIAGFLREEMGLSAGCYHGGMDRGRRQRAHEDFRLGNTRVIAATTAFGMGVDQPAVRMVVHYTIPDSLEAYYHQACRAGRDGLPARCVLLYCPQDRSLHEHLSARSVPEVTHLLAVYQPLARDLSTGGAWVTEESVSRDTDITPSMVSVALEQLIALGAFRVEARRARAVLLTLARAPTAPELDEYARRAGRLRRAHLARLDDMVAYAEGRECRRGTLLRYFGQEPPRPRSDCCDVCAGGHLSTRPAVAPAKLRFPLQVGPFQGWTLGLYRQQAAERPHSGPGRLLYDLKYQGDAEAGRRLGFLMARLTLEHTELREAEMVVPIPATGPADAEPASLVLAREVADRLRLPLATSALSRTAARPPQKELRSREEKQRNIAGAFEVPEPAAIRGRCLLLVDDVFDSGATLEEAGRTLLRAGARQVMLLTAVRTGFGWRRD